MGSIRTRLLFLLMAGLVTVVATGGAWTYARLQDGVNRIMDRELADSAWVLASWTLAEPRKGGEADSASIARELNEMLERMHVGSRRDPRETEVGDELAYTVWREGLVPKTGSAFAPDWLAESRPDGFSRHAAAGGLWHVFTVRTGEPEVVVNVAERDAVRRALLQDMLLWPLFGWVLSIPLAAVVIWAAVHSGLRPLATVAQAMRQRAPGDLGQMSMAVPVEIEPLAAALNDILRRLDALLEEERLFNAAAAHELRTPLAGIQLLAESALESAQDSATQDALRAIVSSVGRAERVLRQLLLLAQVNSTAARSIPLRSFALGPLLEDVLAELQPLANRHKVNLLPCPQVRGIVCADPVSVRVLLRNLIENAILHAGAPGSVGIGVAREGERWRVQVRDDGPGLPSDVRAAVGAPFQRGPRQDQGGSGLGLAIATRIAAMHGTRLTFARGDRHVISFSLAAGEPL